MVSHGISTGALFMLVGMLYDRRGTRQISEFGGIAKRMPGYAAVFLIITFSSIGLPGTNGFVGEFLILVGTFSTEGRGVYAVLGALGVILAAVYMLWMVQRVFFGPIKKVENERLRDLSVREWVVVAPLVLAVFFIGVFPQYFLDRMDVDGAISDLRKAGTEKVIVKASPSPHGDGGAAIEVHAPAGGH
jgi:NADH-quinone oxidoreductase subunit M